MPATNFADRLLAAAEAKGAPVCVGLDPVLDRLPAAIAKAHAGQPVAAIHAFCLGVVEAVAPHVPAVKPQSACFERFGGAGVAAYHDVVRAARDAGLLAIGDAKRGDIGLSSSHYAAALLDGADHDGVGADAITLSPYLGRDSLEPFVEQAAGSGRGVFVLVRTSNPGSSDLQSLRLADGGTVAAAAASLTATLGEPHAGEGGYSAVGAVVGATHPEELAALRERMPRQIFLLPGVGAQGASAGDVRGAFDGEGRGGLVTASRSVLYAFGGGGDWRPQVADAAARLRDDVAAIL